VVRVPSPVIRWDEVEGHAVEQRPFAATWTDLGRAAGCVAAGLRRIAIAPDSRSTPVHVHGAEEEIFFVLEGTGLSWQGGRTCEVRSGDCLVHLAGGEAHTLVAGADGLTVLAFGTRVPVEAAQLPRAGVSWLGRTWATTGAEPHPWAREAAAGPLDCPPPGPRPSNVVNLADVPEEPGAHGDCAWTDHPLSHIAGSVRGGLSCCVVPPGKLGCPPHCHSVEEEIFVVLDGAGVLLLGGTDGFDEHPVRSGSVVARPAGARKAHAFRAGEPGLTYLAYGTREPRDVVWYPRSRKLNFRGLGVIARVEPLEYWDGEG
jgi:uncharacterized cupin superfamily protein